MTRISFWLIAALSLALISPIARAAQEATVSSDQAAIREKPEQTAKILESRPTGASIRISTYNKNGWYKTKTSSGQYGWIWQADVLVMASTGDVQAASLDLKEKTHQNRREADEPWLFLRGGGALFVIISGNLSQALGAGKGHWYIAPTGFLEAAVRVGERLRAALRVATYSSKSTIALNKRNYEVTLSGTPLLLGLDADISRSETFDISAGLYGGISTGTKMTVAATDFQVPNSFTVSRTTLAVLINFTAKYWLKRWLCVVGEAGLMYTRIPKTPLASFNGDDAFRDSTGGLSSLQVPHVGPILGAAVQFAF